MSTILRAGCRVASFALTLSVVLGPLAPATALAQPPKSAAAAKQLTDTLDRLKLDAIAAPDPADPGAFVAALYFQGGQLLVVSAKYSAPSLIVAKLAKKDYRDVYIDLNAASVAGSKIFVMDHSCDGLVAKPGDSQGADRWEHGTVNTVFDGDWKKAKVSEEEYGKSFAAADEKYARILALLTAHAAKAGS
jgi:hypothetical protein